MESGSNIFRRKSATGVTYGASAVRAVTIKKTDTGYAIIKAVDAAIAPNGDDENGNVAEAVLAAGRELGKEKRLVAGLPGTDAGIHFFDMPFDRPERVAKVLRYEAEPLFLTPVDEMLLDHIPLVSGEEDQNQGLVFGAKPEAVGLLLDTLSSGGLEPNMILPDRLGMVWAGTFLFRDEEEPCTRVLLDLGHRQTGVAIFQGNRPQSIRSIYLGGQNITDALAKTLEMEAAEAETLKHQIDLSEASADDWEALNKAYQPLVAEIRRTLAGKILDREGPRPQLVLGGGGAAAPGLAAYLEETLGLETHLIGDYYDGQGGRIELTPQLMTPFGLALLGVTAGYQPNLRQGEFAPSQIFLRHKGTLIFMSILLLLLLSFKIGDLVYSLQLEKQRYLEASQERQRLFLEVMPTSAHIDSGSALILLRRAVEGAGGVSTNLGAKGKVLDILSEISRLTAKYEKLRITDLALNPDMIELQGEGPSYEIIDRFKTALSNLDFFSETNLGGAKMDPTTKVLTFRISMKRKNG